MIMLFHATRHTSRSHWELRACFSNLWWPVPIDAISYRQPPSPGGNCFPGRSPYSMTRGYKIKKFCFPRCENSEGLSPCQSPCRFLVVTPLQFIFALKSCHWALGVPWGTFLGKDKKLSLVHGWICCPWWVGAWKSVRAAGFPHRIALKSCGKGQPSQGNNLLTIHSQAPVTWTRL